MFSLNIQEIRKEFPVMEELIFFDHARVAPLPERVRKVVTEFVDDVSLVYAFYVREREWARCTHGFGM